MTITIYTLPNCVQCDSTKRYLDQKEVSYETVDISKDDKAREFVAGLGFLAAPVVVTDKDKWSGFRLEKLRQTAEEYALTKAS